MKHPIDLEHWNRKEHFLFFGSMDHPDRRDLYL